MRRWRRLARSRPLNEGRDVNPGDTRTAVRSERSGDSLNEGRDVNPGDTHRRPSRPAADVLMFGVLALTADQFLRLVT